MTRKAEGIDESSADKLERQLSLYVDGELDEGERRAFRCRLAQGGEQLEREMETMLSLRRELRESVSERLAEHERRNGRIDIWQQIENRLDAPPLAAARVRALAVEPVRALWEGFLEAARSLNPGMVALAGAAALAILFLAPGLRGAQDVRRSFRMAEGGGLSPFQRVVQEIAAPAVVPDIRSARGAGHEKEQQTEAAHAVPPVIVRGAKAPVVRVNMGGHAAEFDWIQSDRHFEIVSTAKRQLPPIIWVGNRR